MQYYFSREMLESCGLDVCMDSTSLKQSFFSLSSCPMSYISQPLSTSDDLQTAPAVPVVNAIIMAVYKALSVSLHCIPCATQRIFFVDMQNNDSLIFHVYSHSWCYLASCSTNDVGEIYAAVECDNSNQVKRLTTEQHDRLCSELKSCKHFVAQLSDHQSGFRYAPWLAWRARVCVSIVGHMQLKAVQVALPLRYADSRLLPIANHKYYKNGLHTPYHAFLSMHTRSCLVQEKKIYALTHAKTSEWSHKVNRLQAVSKLPIESPKVTELPAFIKKRLAPKFQLFRAHPYRKVSSKLYNVSKSLLGCLVARSIAPPMRFVDSLQRLGIALQSCFWSYVGCFRSLCVCVLLWMSYRASGATIFTTTTIMLVGLYPNVILYACLSLFACYLITKSIKDAFYNSKASFRACLYSGPNRLFDDLEIGKTCKKNSSDSKQYTRLHSIHHQRGLARQRLIYS